jgi:SRSO17 transposase
LETQDFIERYLWAIKDCFKTTKNEFGLDHNGTRSRHGRHRRVSLMMLTFAMKAFIQHQANAVSAPKKLRALKQTALPHPLVGSENPPLR